MMKCAALALGLVASVVATLAQAEPRNIKWGTSQIGGAGHKSLVVLADLLNKEMPDLRISVLPTPSAATSMKGFALGDFDGYFGSQVALDEFATDSGRMKGVKEQTKFKPVQSFWCFTLDVGLAIKSNDSEEIKSWGMLGGRDVYTGPLSFDARKHLENAMTVLNVKHNYKQVDLSTAGSQLQAGAIKGMFIYAANSETPAPWIAEASLAVDWVPLNPSPAELEKLKAAGFPVRTVEAAWLHPKGTKEKSVTLLPIYFGFNLGMNISAEDMYQVLMVIEKNADQLVTTDANFRPIANGRMAEFQKAALQITADMVPIHPGLAKYLKSKNLWESKWDSKVAQM